MREIVPILEGDVMLKSSGEEVDFARCLQHCGHHVEVRYRSGRVFRGALAYVRSEERAGIIRYLERPAFEVTDLPLLPRLGRFPRRNIRVSAELVCLTCSGA